MEDYYDFRRLSDHPCVFFVDGRRLILKFEFRLELFKAWKENQDPLAISRLLSEKGLSSDLVGAKYFMNLATGFKNSGYPLPHHHETEALTNYISQNPLIMSGKFVNYRKGLSVESGFLKELKRHFPETSVKDLLILAGLDPLDVGVSRMNWITHSLRREPPQPCPILSPASADSGTVSPSDNNKTSEEEPSFLSSLELHPYVLRATPSGISLKNAFYNEAYLLYPLGIDQILKIFELPAQQFPASSKSRIQARLCTWMPGNEALPEISGQILRIRKNKLRELDRLVRDQFMTLGKPYHRMDVHSKRLLCRHLQDIPRDRNGVFTFSRILKLAGIPKSTCYALLNDEEYGSSAVKRAFCDEEDIKLIRQVIDYKGFKKGIRQIYMLMPKVTGQSFSLYRIRRLMNKYGIRTTIRRPSRNRKAVKELISRNRKANLLMRRFRLFRPNEIRLTDVTYLDYSDGQRAYGSASVDPVTGRLICFIVSENNDLQLALDTLEAMEEHPAKRGAILHSDQGTLYMTDDFQAAVVEKELNQSMSRRGNCWDNAPQESFFGHFKDECHYRECKTLEELRSMISSYGVYYNTERGMWDKDHMTPEEYEKYLDAMDEEEWKEHLAAEEERYLKSREASAAKAVEEARKSRDEVQEKLEELKR